MLAMYAYAEHRSSVRDLIFNYNNSISNTFSCFLILKLQVELITFLLTPLNRVIHGGER